jgi:hypothetical protein
MTQSTPVDVKVAALLIRISRLYRPGMSTLELYEATRGTWRLGDRRKRVRYAFAIFKGVVREVYEIERWHPAGSTPYATRDAAKLKVKRWEFMGHVADESIRAEYVGRLVAAYFNRGQQSPTVYVNC